jgi:hypothetical protein
MILLKPITSLFLTKTMEILPLHVILLTLLVSIGGGNAEVYPDGACPVLSLFPFSAR